MLEKYQNLGSELEETVDMPIPLALHSNGKLSVGYL